jgi:hypothetical protein
MAYKTPSSLAIFFVLVMGTGKPKGMDKKPTPKFHKNHRFLHLQEKIQR